MFEEIDDDLLPGDASEDIIQEEDIQTQTEDIETFQHPVKRSQN